MKFVMSTLAERDRQLIQIVDAALVEAARKSGDWLVCRPGCTQCCIGVFAISQLDAARLREGLAGLEKSDPPRAANLRRRVRDAAEQLAPDFPGDPVTGILDQNAEAEDRFADYANDAPCPVLDPETGRCDLYASRPMTCRVFGPPVRSGEGLGVCELCYQGATADEIAACEMVPDPDGLERGLAADFERASRLHGQTIVTFALSMVHRG